MRLRGRPGRFVHGLTSSGTPSACFVGLKVHEIMRREGLFSRPASIGRYVKEGLAADFWTILRPDWLEAGEFLPVL